MDLHDELTAHVDEARRHMRRQRVPRRRAPEPTAGGALRVGPVLTVEPLQVYERNGDGHTLRRHCDPTPGADARRLAAHPGLSVTGSFTSVEVAQRATEACVEANRVEVLNWLAGESGRRVIAHDMGRVIGTVLRRSRWLAGDTAPKPATLVLTVLRRNPAYSSGFAVRTSYPVRREAVRPVAVHLEETSR